MRKWIVVMLVCGCSGGEDRGDDRHGTVELQVALAASAPTDLLGDTARVEASLEYGECLTGFYEKRPDLTIAGVEGERVFADWEQRLCGEDPGAAPCEVLGFDQNLDHAFLEVDYEVERVVENHWFAYGPVPLEDLAGCVTTMRVTDDLSLAGYSIDDTLLWETRSFEPAEAASGDGQAIRFSVGEPD